MNPRIIRIACFICLLANGCNTVSDTERYRDLVSTELNTGVKKNSIFLDLTLGMSEKIFYDYCWKMNNKKLFFNSHDNNAVIYQVNEGLKSEATFRFTPEFYQAQLYKISVDAHYDAFAPWNHNLFADSLQKDLLRLFNNWYGHNQYLMIKNASEEKSLIRIDGNRQIRIKKMNEKDIRIEYTDLFIEKLFHAKVSS